MGNSPVTPATPAGRAAPLSAASAGELLRLVREGHASTRADVAAVTGLARSTVSQRVDALLAHGLLHEAGEARSTGGRPPVVLAFNPTAGVVLAADLGATHSRIAVTDLAGTPLAESRQEMDIADGPDEVLAAVEELFTDLLAQAGVDETHVAGIGIGLPGPVEHATGRPVNPPIMPGWDGIRVPERLQARYGAHVPVLVDNDVNIMAAGEHWTRWQAVDDLLYIKVGTGIGCGIVAGGRIHRGAQGAAGDLGHIQVPDAVVAQLVDAGAQAPMCRCGNVGCVEAVAGGAALARQLAARGYDTRNARDVVRLVRGGDAEAGTLVRAAGRVLGEVLAAAVNLFNPSVIIIGGDMARAHEQLLAGVREVVYSRSLPLATRHLEIVRSTLDDRAGITGAAAMVIEHVLSPPVVDAWLAAQPERRVTA